MARFQFRLNKAIQKQALQLDPKKSNPTFLFSTKTKSTDHKTTDHSNSLKSGNPQAKGFKKETYYEAVLEWNLQEVNRPFKYQRLGMKSWTSFAEAVQDITAFVTMLNNISSDRATMYKVQVVRIVGIYERSAFKDWSTDPYNALEGQDIKQHIKDIINITSKEKGKRNKKPISYVSLTDMKVR